MFKVTIDWARKESISEMVVINPNSYDFKTLFKEEVETASRNAENVIGVCFTLTIDRRIATDSVHVEGNAILLSAETYGSTDVDIKKIEKNVYHNNFWNLEEFDVHVIPSESGIGSYSIAFHNKPGYCFCHSQENNVLYFSKVDGNTHIVTAPEYEKFAIAYCPGRSDKSLPIDSDNTDTPVTCITINTFYRL